MTIIKFKGVKINFNNLVIGTSIPIQGILSDLALIFNTPVNSQYIPAVL